MISYFLQEELQEEVAEEEWPEILTLSGENPSGSQSEASGASSSLVADTPGRKKVYKDSDIRMMLTKRRRVIGSGISSTTTAIESIHSSGSESHISEDHVLERQNSNQPERQISAELDEQNHQQLERTASEPNQRQTASQTDLAANDIDSDEGTVVIS